MTLKAPPGFAHRLKAEAYARGAMLAGVARLGEMETANAFDDWIADGYAGEMHYLERGAEKRRDSRLPVEGAVSALVIAVNYGGTEPDGPVARYARGDDYHDVIVPMLRGVQDWASAELGVRVPGKAYTDTGPILERDLARRAGLGWFGKNTMLISPRHGSFFFLGVLLLGLELEVDAPFASDHCGTCTRCLEACPTDAFVAPRRLDATRCVSYLTIEAKGEIPEALREGVGGLIYGCDVCQSCCPWNMKFSEQLSERAFDTRPAVAHKDARMLARDLMRMSQAEFSAAFTHSPMKRAKLRGLKRNAAVVLGNVGTIDDVALLESMMQNEDALVREHAEWAQARIVGDDRSGQASGVEGGATALRPGLRFGK
ncbi:MAG TPA: tRNA epoxyqueuosine(34) reductase QueG [Gemmatimonadaceae bacterium]|nr:tRNA epoxyqueuosine(34) reductase QueG [Gemmatimonadaceae bacterium]